MMSAASSNIIPSSNSNSTLLFACSRCYSRHPFEELSAGQQLCKKCRGDFPVVKCTYCRSEFQQSSKGSTASICKKCEQNVKQYGKPSACEYCNIIAAFIGNRCQRCTNSEKKYGPPVTCEQCKCKCAFDRKDENKKVDGKLLCWLCTMSFKRALAKAKGDSTSRHSHVRLSNNGNSKAQRNSDKRSGSSKNSHLHHERHHKRPMRPDVTKMQGSNSGGVNSNSQPSSSTQAPDSSSLHSYSPNNETPPPHKKASLNMSSSNDLSSILHDQTTSSDHVVALTQLREQIASLQRQLTQKDKQLLEKDRQITELKAANFTTENELRNKLKNIQREHENKIEGLNNKLKTMQKEIATLNRNNKGKSSLTIVSNRDKNNSDNNSPVVKDDINDDSN
ncbi:unnamed protein product [Orchesella dallaii]|uniref:Protein FAM76A n=1 Tax=Orchesella dallaii TaxID=48710 RepID=A0ABP1QMC8_9HEXA